MTKEKKKKKWFFSSSMMDDIKEMAEAEASSKAENKEESLITSTAQYEKDKAEEEKVDATAPQEAMDFQTVVKELEDLKQLRKEFEAKEAALKQQQETLAVERRAHQDLQNRFDNLSAQEHIKTLKVEELEQEKHKWDEALQHVKEQNSELSRKNIILQSSVDKLNQENSHLKEQVTELKNQLKKSEADSESHSKVTAVLSRIYEDYPTQEAVKEARTTIEEAKQSKLDLEKEKEQVLTQARAEAEATRAEAKSEADALKQEQQDKLQELNEKIEAYTTQLDAMSTVFASVAPSNTVN